MSRKSTGILKAALSTLHYSGLDGLMAPFTGGAGAIFMLHHVRPARDGAFQPNRILEVTPEFLEAVIELVQARGLEIVSLDTLHERLLEGNLDRPFACFTFDDGYRDNLRWAYPIFRRHNIPMAIYVSSDLADGTGNLWWLALERAVAATDIVEVKIDGTYRRFACATATEKDRAFHAIYWWLRRIREEEARQTVADLCRIHEVDVSQMCRELVMDWNELRGLATDNLVTIGAHTRSHLALSKLSIADARLEMESSIERIERELGTKCHHFSYPYGDETSAGSREFTIAAELGLHTAVTTRKGLIRPEHASQITALPRVSLNGEFQDPRYVKVLLSGAPFAFWNMATRFVARPGAAMAP